MQGRKITLPIISIESSTYLPTNGRTNVSTSADRMRIHTSRLFKYLVPTKTPHITGEASFLSDQNKECLGSEVVFKESSYSIYLMAGLFHTKKMTPSTPILV